MKLLVISLLILESFNVNAQEKYIEVVVKDTLLVDADTWNYRFTINNFYENRFMFRDTAFLQNSKPNQTDELKQKMKTADSLKALAMSLGARLSGDSQMQDYSTGSETNLYTGISVELVFNKKTSLELFIKVLKEYKNISGYISLVSCSSSGVFQTKLINKILEDGRKEAESLASLSKKRLGEVIFISESIEKNPFEDFLNSIKNEGSSAAGWHAVNGNTIDKVKLEKVLKIRFALL